MMPGLDLVPARPLATSGPIVRIRLEAGDRVLVASGEPVAAGAPLVERPRAPRLEVLATLPAGAVGRPGERFEAGQPVPHRGDRRAPVPGELLFESGGRWRAVVADQADAIDAPAPGIVREVRPGVEIRLEVAGHGLPGVLGLGVPTRGRLALGTDEAGELRPGSLDVGRAGTILVVGSRVDAETLTRARAMGVRGIVVAGLAGKEERDFLASEQRQRAALHRLPPFAVLVLDGAVRRPIASAVMDLLRALEGQEVGLSEDPPALLFEGPVPTSPQADRLRVRFGALAGREGTFAGLAGPRRFRSGVHAEAALVGFPDGSVRALPLADLERYA